MVFPRKQRWTSAQLFRRMVSLRRDGFTDEEANDLARWSQPLTHWVLRNMRRDRRRLIRNMRRQGRTEEEIEQIMRGRYRDLGVQGQYENEDWYVSRVGAA